MTFSKCKALLLGGVNISFRAADPEIQLVYASNHQPFINSLEPDFTFMVSCETPNGISLKSPDFYTKTWSYYSKDNYIAIRTHPVEKPYDRDKYTIIIYPTAKTGILLFEDQPTLRDGSIYLEVPPPSLDEILAAELVSLQNGLMFHSCGLRTKEGSGILFTGYSGSGKSTTAKLWQEFGEASIIGDERITVFTHDGCFWLQGTAWHHDGRVSLLGETQVESLFILEHAETNKARALTPIKAVSLLMSRAFLPFWDRRLMTQSLEFLDNLCQNIPCYQLGFYPDKQAVDYVKCLIS